MNWNFSVGWMLFGLLVSAVGVFVVGNYQKISDTVLSGISSYDRCKFWGMVTIVVGLIITANLHTLLLSILVSIVFKK